MVCRVRVFRVSSSAVCLVSWKYRLTSAPENSTTTAGLNCLVPFGALVTPFLVGSNPKPTPKPETLNQFPEANLASRGSLTLSLSPQRRMKEKYRGLNLITRAPSPKYLHEAPIPTLTHCNALHSTFILKDMEYLLSGEWRGQYLCEEETIDREGERIKEDPT